MLSDLSREEMLANPFDPIERSRAVEAIVMEGESRRYYRFRHANFYGPSGIVTGDLVGCNLLCDWGSHGRCWNYARNASPEGVGKLHSPMEVVAKLEKLAKKHSCNLIRLSGAEPFMGAASSRHLVAIMRSMENYNFVIETNGIVLGYDPSLAEMLRGIANIQEIRVSLKGWNREQYTRNTGSLPIAMDYQVAAIHALDLEGFNVQVAVSDAVFGSEESLYFLGDNFDIERKFEVEATRKYNR